MQENIVFIFPGHGSQCVGMCRDIFKNYFEARYAFEEVSDIVNKSIYKLCFNSDQKTIDIPQNASLVVFSYSLAIARILESLFERPLSSMAYAMAGHAMGQYSALHCAGSINLPDTLKILNEPGHYKYFGSAKDCGMIAVVGSTRRQLRYLMELTHGHGYAEIANHNSGLQYTISGQKSALDIMMDNSRARGAQFARRLNVGVPANCVLMEPAADKLAQTLRDIDVKAPRTKVFSCSTAECISTPQDIKNELVYQVTHGVQWIDVMNKFPKHFITRAYELGPGLVLTRLVNRTQRHCNAMQTDSLPHLKAVIKSLESVMNVR